MTKYRIHTDGVRIYVRAAHRHTIILTPEDFLDLQEAMRDFTVETLRLGIKGVTKKK